MIMQHPSLSSDSDYDSFQKLLSESAESLLKIPKNKTIKVIGHLDADGICSSAIMINALIKLNRRYSLATLPAITEDALRDIKEENDEYIVFVDLGSGNLDAIGTILTNKKIFILDHHELHSNITYENIVQVNPHICGIDGSDEISGAGVVFMFTQCLT